MLPVAAQVRKGTAVQKVRVRAIAQLGGASSRPSATPCACSMMKYSPEVT